MLGIEPRSAKCKASDVLSLWPQPFTLYVSVAQRGIALSISLPNPQWKRVYTRLAAFNSSREAKSQGSLAKKLGCSLEIWPKDTSAGSNYNHCPRIKNKKVEQKAQEAVVRPGQARPGERPAHPRILLPCATEGKRRPKEGSVWPLSDFLYNLASSEKM